MSDKCPDIDKCTDIIRQMLDQEASVSDEAFLLKRFEDCKCCFEQYELEVALRNALKSKLRKRPVPEGLENSIRAKILQSTFNAN